MAIFGIIRGGAESWSCLAFSAVLVSLPVVLVFLVLQICPVEDGKR
jgi:ABC-type maltose transport system permease subunit